MGKGSKKQEGAAAKAGASKAVEAVPSNEKGSTAPSSPSTSRFPIGSSMSFLVLLLAVAVGIFLNQKSLTPPSPRPAKSETLENKQKSSELNKNVANLCPSTEMSRGYANTMQARLYEGLDPAVMLIINDNDKENDVFIHWKGDPKAVAPAGSRSRIETFVGHEFRIFSKSSTLNVTMGSPFIAYEVDPKDGSIRKLDVTDESAIPPLKFPALPESHISSTAKAIKVRNLSNKRFHNFWVPESGAPVYQGVVEPNSESTTTSYLTHTFRFTDLKDKSKTIFQFSVLPDQEIYAYVDENTADKTKLQSHLEEVAFAKEYKAKHNGRPWLSYYPHGPVKSFMWPADYIGQEFRRHTVHGPNGENLNFTLKVVSVRPRAYEVEYFISDDEAKFIIDSAKAKLHRSSVEMHGEDGERLDSDTRTSKNAWLARGQAGGIIDRIYRRVADLLNLPEQSLHHDPPDGCAENMQVVYYKNSAHYAPHHDWGVRGGPHTRLITVLLYLNEPIVGGETAFPLAKIGRSSGLIVKPKKGKAVLFYSQYPDGNVDDESLHEARAVTKGEKFLANVWVHDKAYWREHADY